MPRCYVCGNEENNTIVHASEKMFGFGGDFQYLACARCEHVQIQDIPKTLGDYYPKNYYSYQPQGKLVAYLKRKRAAATFQEPGLLGALLKKAFGPSPIHQWYKLAGVSKEDRILDIGCGDGLFIRELVEAGFKSITGIDPFIQADREFGPTVRVLKKSTSEISGPFDFIMMNHSFEHMDNPKEILSQVAKLLAPKGRLLIRVPVIGYAWREYRENWVSLDAPRHLFIPSPRSLVLMAETAGLKLVSSEYDSTAFQFWASEQYKQDIFLESERSYLKNPKAFSKEAIAAFEAKAQDLNKKKDGDQANFLLVRAGDFA